MPNFPRFLGSIFGKKANKQSQMQLMSTGTDCAASHILMTIDTTNHNYASNHHHTHSIDRPVRILTPSYYEHIPIDKNCDTTD